VATAPNQPPLEYSSARRSRSPRVSIVALFVAALAGVLSFFVGGLVLVRFGEAYNDIAGFVGMLLSFPLSYMVGKVVYAIGPHL
jgi:hypothetical protein